MMQRYFHATQWAFVFLIIFVVLTYFLPDGRDSSSVELLLTISTFLFAVLAGFYLTRLNNRYDRVRELIAQEDAHWITVYELSATLGQKYREGLVPIIDAYYQAMFDYRIGEAHRSTQKHVDQLYTILREIQPVSESEKSAYGNTVDTLADIEVERNATAVVCLERLTPGQWATLLTLAAIILFSIFYLKGNVFFSDAMVVLLATVLTLILLVMRDLQNFFLGGTSMVDESSQQVFEVIGMPRYFPKAYLDEHPVIFPRDVKTFRVGHHNLYIDHNAPVHIESAKVGEFRTTYK